MATQKNVEFPAFDGTILRGTLTLPARENAPVVIMTAGSTFLKHHFLPFIVRHFQAAAADYSSAITYLSTLAPAIDPSSIAIWGAGHAGGVVMLTAMLDERVKGSVIAMPFFSGQRDALFWPEGLWGRVWEERANGVGGGEVEYVPIFADTRQEAERHPGGRLIGSLGAFDFWERCKGMSDEAGVEWENRVVLQSLFHMRYWEPAVYLPQTKSPVLWIMPKKDEFTPFETQKDAFSTIKAPKTVLEPNSGNLEAFMNDEILSSLSQQQVDWFTKAL